MVSLISGWGNTTLTSGIVKQAAPNQLSNNSGTTIKTTQLYKANFPTNNVNTKLVGGVAIKRKSVEESYNGYTIRCEYNEDGSVKKITIFKKEFSRECTSTEEAKGCIDALNTLGLNK